MANLKYIPEVNKIYGQWKVISTEIKRGNARQTYWKVQCECGRESWRLASALVKNRTNSCKSCAKTVNNVNAYILSYCKKVERRAINIKVNFNLTPEYLENLYEEQDKKCFFSQEEIIFRPKYDKNNQTASLDRLNNNLGYIKGNVKWVHKDVNFMKGVLTQQRFLELCNKIKQNI